MRAFVEWITTNRLTTILLVAYLFLTAIVFEQSRVIDTQRTLIQQLFGDSVALNHIRWQRATERARNR
jgi:hypothetical protein